MGKWGYLIFFCGGEMSVFFFFGKVVETDLGLEKLGFFILEEQTPFLVLAMGSTYDQSKSLVDQPSHVRWLLVTI